MTFHQRMEKLSLKKRKSDMMAHVLFCISIVVIKITKAIWEGTDLFHPWLTDHHPGKLGQNSR